MILERIIKLRDSLRGYQKLVLKIIFSGLFILAFAKPVDAESFKIGDKTIEIPPPSGFSLITSDMDFFIPLQSNFIKNDLASDHLAYYILESDIPVAMSGEITFLERYCILMVGKDIKEVVVDSKFFDQLKNSITQKNRKVLNDIKKEIPDLLERLSKGVSEELNIDFIFKLYQIIPLNSHYNADNAISYSMYVSHAKIIENIRENFITSGTITAVNIQGKIIFLSCYGRKEELEWTRDISKKWTEAVIENNFVSQSNKATKYPIEKFIRVNLPKNVSIELSEDWVVLSENRRIKLEDYVDKLFDLSETEQEESELSFAANYYDDRDNVLGILNIRYYPQLELTQADAEVITAQEINELDAIIKENITASMKPVSFSIISWAGTQKISINGIIVLLTEYKRQSLKDGKIFRVRLVRVFADDKSFTLTVSYNEDVPSRLEPMTDRIINSLSFKESLRIKAVETSVSKAKPQGSSVAAGWHLIFLSTLFSWVIGLIPPLLIRFVFIRRPIGKGWAIGIVVLFWMINSVIFAALRIVTPGVHTRPYLLMGLIMIVSYAILRKNGKKMVVSNREI